MGIISGDATSRRGYLSQSELEQYANITVTDSAEADDRINQAEELIDAYVAHTDKFYKGKLTGRISSVPSTSSFMVESLHQNITENDYYKGCEIEIIGGTGAGQRRRITSSTKAGLITVDSVWTTTPDTTSFYSIYQLGKFPRHLDVEYYSLSAPFTYYKQIPEAVKRAVAAQVEYIIEMGDAFFSGDKSGKQSESIGDYSYNNFPGGGVERLISPKAKMYLKGYKNRTGKILIDTSL